MSELEKNNSISLEDYLAPPKYDGLGVLMALIAALIVACISGVIILLISFLTIGKFSLESGMSPILLAMISFFGLIIGNLLNYFLLSRIYPDIYTRSRTVFSQIAIMSILLYIFFAPVYIMISSMIDNPKYILLVFSAHVIINTFSFHLLIGLIAQYRYALLVLYSNIVSLIFTSCVVVLTYQVFRDSSQALFLLLGLVIVAQVSSSLLSHILSWLYYHLYTITGYDPLGSIFSRIEHDEKQLEQKASDLLTRFHP
jgi:hypothetical protein